MRRDPGGKWLPMTVILSSTWAGGPPKGMNNPLPLGEGRVRGRAAGRRHVRGSGAKDLGVVQQHTGAGARLLALRVTPASPRCFASLSMTAKPKGNRDTQQPRTQAVYPPTAGRVMCTGWHVR